MNLETRLVPRLKPLAWCLEVRRGRPDVTLWHGPSVDVRGDAFFEGAWDGPFAGFDPFAATTRMGTGGLVTGGALHVAAPSHNYHRLMTVADPDRLWVSNSLPLVLACASDGPDLAYPGYHRTIGVLDRAGATHDQPGRLPTVSGRTLLVHIRSSIDITPDLEIHYARPRASAPPHDYAEYRALLTTTTQRLVENATDPARAVPLRTLATLSAGYDSSAAAVVMREAGVADAITTPASGAPGAGDSGWAIAERLGFAVHPLDVDAWRTHGALGLADHLVCGAGNQSFGLRALAGTWDHTLVSIGSLGDLVWDPNATSLGSDLEQPSAFATSHAGLAELRLRHALVFLHLPAIAGEHASDVQAIGRSAEMDPWHVDGDYDRPIPRRLLEEAGVPRDWFGIRKRSALAVETPEILEQLEHTDFPDLCDDAARTLSGATGLRLRAGVHYGVGAARRADSLLTFARRCERRLGLPEPLRISKASRTWLGAWRGERGLPMLYTFHWAARKLADEYRDALTNETA